MTKHARFIIGKHSTIVTRGIEPDSLPSSPYTERFSMIYRPDQNETPTRKPRSITISECPNGGYIVYDNAASFYNGTVQAPSAAFSDAPALIAWLKADLTPAPAKTSKRRA